MALWSSKKNSITVILDQAGIIGNVDIDKNIDIILTPSFYWFVEREFSVKFNFQIKEYLPSIFEEFTDTQVLSYLIVPKQNGLFWLFAYDDKAILKALNNAGIDSSKVGKVYFAQNVFSKTDAIDLDNGYALISIKNGISRVPKTLINDTLLLKNIKESEPSLTKGIILKKYTNFIDENLIKKIMVPFVLIIFLEVIQVVALWRENQKLSLKKQEVFNSYNLPSTMFQNRSILKSLERKNLKQQKIRSFIDKIFKASFKTEEHLQTFEISDTKALVEIKLKNIKDAENFKDYFIKSIDFADIENIIVKDSIMRIKFKL